MTPTNARKALHAQESQIAQAARAVLSAAGFTNVRLAGDPSILPDNTCRVRVRRGDATGAQALVGTYAVEPTHRPVYSQWTAVLEVVYVRKRRENDESTIDGVERVTDEQRGAIRELFDAGSYPFNATNLPLLIVDDIMPLAGDETVDREKHLDVILENFRVTYELRRTAIPTPSPA